MSYTKDDQLPNGLVRNYFHSLVNCYFKILPIREDGEKTIGVYLESLKAEMLGCGSLLNDIKNDPSYEIRFSQLPWHSHSSSIL